MMSAFSSHATYRVMLVASDTDRNALLTRTLHKLGNQVIQQEGLGADLLNRVQQQQPDIIVIDLDQVDTGALQQLSCLNRQRPTPVVMFAREDQPERIEEAIRAGVSAYVVDELYISRIATIMRVALTRFREDQALRQELDKTREQLEARKEIEKAKGLLMKHKQLDEATAYQTLRSMAMNNNMKLADMARNVISVMEVLA